MAKALFWACPDTERRKLGERVGLDTPLVLAVNDGNFILGNKKFRMGANALSFPPGKYARKSETQRN
jgi:hypothetical protein